MKTTLILGLHLIDYLNLQADEIHEDNIRWNAQMAGVDMVQSTRQQGSQEVIYHYQTKYLLGLEFFIKSSEIHVHGNKKPGMVTGGATKKKLIWEAPPRGPIPYPTLLCTILGGKDTPFLYLTLTNGTPSTGL